MEDNNKFIMGMISGPFVVIITLLIIIPTLLLAGFLLSTLWNWWIAPTFGVKTLTIIEAMGIELVIRYFRTVYYENSTKTTFKSYMLGIFTDLMLVGLAWILLFFK